MMQKSLFAVLAICSSFWGERLQAQSALQRSLQSANYQIEFQSTTSSHQSPLWLNANRHGLSSIKGDNAALRLSMCPKKQDSTSVWRIGYGVDFAIANNFTSQFIIQQLYADFNYKDIRLSVGSKEQNAEQKHPFLSSGSQTFGTNARPIPQIRIEVPSFIRLLKHSDWIKFKGHFSYGFLTDQKFHESYAKSYRYTKGALYHSKAGYLRLGNEEKFPIVFEGGLEMASVFGGTIYNYSTSTPVLKLPSGIKAAFHAIYGGGSDPTDGNYKNVGGNMLGSLLFSLSYHFNNWKVRSYFDHFFEDHSQIFWQYGWKDGLWGVELTLPKNQVIESFVYEYITTRDQSGPMMHNATPALPYQISGMDNYYNHGLYAGWQHWGQAIGNPLYISPLYKADGSLDFRSNRFHGHHFGLMGNPTKAFSYRLLFSHTKHWGTYEKPYTDPKYLNSFLAEISYRPLSSRSLLKGWGLTLSFGKDGGNQHQQTTGFSVSIKKQGLLF